jgi:hypothetical protein
MKKIVFLFGVLLFFFVSFNLNANTNEINLLVEEINLLTDCGDSADHWIWVEIGIYGAFEDLNAYYDAWWWWYDACLAF